MQLRPDALRLVLAQGLPAVVTVTGTSMTPSLALGERLQVQPLAAGGPARTGEIVLVITSDSTELLLHRVMHVFSHGGRAYVVHQGDAAASTFAICPSELVLARATGFVEDPGRPLPTVEAMSAAMRAQFHRRRLACVAFCWSRRLALTAGLGDGPLRRRLGRAVRGLARKLAG